MKHFSYLTDKETDRVFFVKPTEFTRFTDKERLSYALGATLYMPSKKDIVKKIRHREIRGLTTMVMCFEDAIREEDVKNAEDNVLSILSELRALLKAGKITQTDLPLFFLRVRNIYQFEKFVLRLSKDDFNILTGFIFPKFDSSNGEYYLAKVKELSDKYGITVYGMPILESSNIIYTETRTNELLAIKSILGRYKDYVLNIRVGGTDFSSRFGLRRSIDYTIYDIGVVSSCLNSILNQFARQEDDYVVSAPVWEYFPGKRIFKPRLRETPFNIHHMRSYRDEIIDTAIDGLIRETVLDRANGFTGKTIIHPSHITFVNAIQCVTKEEYLDAKMILDNRGGGVIRGMNNNKMNEVNPHTNWANKIMHRAEIYGVINNADDYVELF